MLQRILADLKTVSQDVEEGKIKQLNEFIRQLKLPEMKFHVNLELD